MNSPEKWSKEKHEIKRNECLLGLIICVKVILVQGENGGDQSSEITAQQSKHNHPNVLVEIHHIVKISTVST